MKTTIELQSSEKYIDSQLNKGVNNMASKSQHTRS